MTVHWSLAVKNFVGPIETPDVTAILAYAARAEAPNFESLSAWDHVILGVEPAFLILDAVRILTAIAVPSAPGASGRGDPVTDPCCPPVAGQQEIRAAGWIPCFFA